MDCDNSIKNASASEEHSSPRITTNRYWKSRHRSVSNESVEQHAIFGADLNKVPKSVIGKDCECEETCISDSRGIRGDIFSILLLIFFYVLQGIPVGVSASIPFILQSKNATYEDQALYSSVRWPSILKILWAPIIDSVYSTRIGRRKTWLVPVQFFIGLLMVGLSTKADTLMGDDGSGVIQIEALTYAFFSLNILAATQEVVIDGWALTMLSRDNVGWASICRTIGQIIGMTTGNVLFLTLESTDFANSYVRSVPEDGGFVTLSSFLLFWGIILLVTTALVVILKRERINVSVDPIEGVLPTYKTLFNVLRLPSVISLAVIHLTSKLTFSGNDGLAVLKMIEAGMSRVTLVFIATGVASLRIVFPLMISKHMAGPRPLVIWLKAYPCRIVISTVFCPLIYWAGMIQPTPGVFPGYFYLLLIVMLVIHQMTICCMIVSLVAFHAKVSDPAIGASYICLLNTMANVGDAWPQTLALSLVDYFTWRFCTNGDACHTKHSQEICRDAGWTCVTVMDGYWVFSGLGIVIGVLWLWWGSKRVQQLSDLSDKAWKCRPVNA